MIKGFADLADKPEDERIRIIVEIILTKRYTVAVVVDDEAGKAERYARKLRAACPGIVIGAALPGPTAGAVTMRVGPPPTN